MVYTTSGKSMKEAPPKLVALPLRITALCGEMLLSRTLYHRKRRISSFRDVTFFMKPALTRQSVKKEEAHPKIVGSRAKNDDG
ncbi:MAG: hypothetical protein SOW68_10860, partial [Eubacteriales bacterium]|nr:hypothetical protein [Eubacteriales bacterium]